MSKIDIYNRAYEAVYAAILKYGAKKRLHKNPDGGDKKCENKKCENYQKHGCRYGYDLTELCLAAKEVWDGRS